MKVLERKNARLEKELEEKDIKAGFFDLSGSLGTEGSLRALRMAHANRTYAEEPLIHHSDRGIQYCSDQYQEKLRKYDITTSMTESYDPYANAIAERVNGILKQEKKRCRKLPTAFKLYFCTVKKM